jgi:hypothetical protein
LKFCPILVRLSVKGEMIMEVYNEMQASHAARVRENAAARQTIANKFGTVLGLLLADCTTPKLGESRPPEDRQQLFFGEVANELGSDSQKDRVQALTAYSDYIDDKIAKAAEAASRDKVYG